MKKVNRDYIEQVIDTNFSGTYLTILGIIQSVALGILALEIFQRKTVDTFKSGDWFPLIGGLITFLILVLVWYAYQWYTYLDRWSMTLRDSFIPFLIGLVEIGLSKAIWKPLPYLCFLTIMSFVGAFGYWHTLNRISLKGEEFYDPRELYKYHVQHQRASVVVSVISGVWGLILLAGTWACTCVERNLTWWVISFFLGLIFLFGSSFCYWNKMIKAVGIEEGKGKLW